MPNINPINNRKVYVLPFPLKQDFVQHACEQNHQPDGNDKVKLAVHHGQVEEPNKKNDNGLNEQVQGIQVQ